MLHIYIYIIHILFTLVIPLDIRFIVSFEFYLEIPINIIQFKTSSCSNMMGEHSTLHMQRWITTIEHDSKRNALRSKGTET